MLALSVRRHSILRPEATARRGETMRERCQRRLMLATTNAANPGGITASAAIVNLRQRQKPTRMPGVPRPPREPPQILSREIVSKRNRRRHPIPQCQCTRESRFAQRWESPE